MAQAYEKCIIEEMQAANDGSREARQYLQNKLEGVERTPDGRMGDLVECDRCLASFRLLAGGVYLETEPMCSRPIGQRQERHGYILNLDYDAIGA